MKVHFMNIIPHFCTKYENDCTLQIGVNNNEQKLQRLYYAPHNYFMDEATSLLLKYEVSLFGEHSRNRQHLLTHLQTHPQLLK
jgi:hypothetical protein